MASMPACKQHESEEW